MGKRVPFWTPNWNLRTEPKRTSHKDLYVWQLAKGQPGCAPSSQHAGQPHSERDADTASGMRWRIVLPPSIPSID